MKVRRIFLIVLFAAVLIPSAGLPQERPAQVRPAQVPPAQVPPAQDRLPQDNSAQDNLPQDSLAQDCLPQDKDIVGRIEEVRLYPGDLLLRAKLDTGAKNCSLNAPKMTKFSQNGQTWVRFSIKDHHGEEATIERRIIRLAKIKQNKADAEKRPVIMLGICLGRQYREVEVNLVDRTDFNYQILIGRSFMMGHLVVDPELKYTAAPDCVGAPMP